MSASSATATSTAIIEAFDPLIVTAAVRVHRSTVRHHGQVPGGASVQAHCATAPTDGSGAGRRRYPRRRLHHLRYIPARWRTLRTRVIEEFYGIQGPLRLHRTARPDSRAHRSPARARSPHRPLDRGPLRHRRHRELARAPTANAADLSCTAGHGSSAVGTRRSWAWPTPT